MDRADFPKHFGGQFGDHGLVGEGVLEHCRGLVIWLGW